MGQDSDRALNLDLESDLIGNVDMGAGADLGSDLVSDLDLELGLGLGQGHNAKGRRRKPRKT